MLKVFQMWKICFSSFLKVSSFKVKVFESEFFELLKILTFRFEKVWERVLWFIESLKCVKKRCLNCWKHQVSTVSKISFKASKVTINTFSKYWKLWKKSLTPLKLDAFNNSNTFLSYTSNFQWIKELFFTHFLKFES
jgi:hypothetical protein